MSENKVVPSKSLLERLASAMLPCRYDVTQGAAFISAFNTPEEAEAMARNYRDSVISPMYARVDPELLREARNTIAAQQAEIDRLMWEHCPDEMTGEQIARWEAAQVPANESLPVPDFLLNTPKGSP